uniref:Chemosensory protein 8 n=1 Tax=Dendrolimus punctatus TaxID=238572 RepID=A0A2K8GL12_9NEOP|nr:Chemosensory protein 8 [Dendrolimus punctatus]
MKWYILSAIFALTTLVAAEQYTDRYDNMNIDEIMANRKLLIPYIKCALDMGRCTPEGKELKEHIKDAMQTACEKCTAKQKVYAKKVVKHIKAHEAQYWQDLKQYYDPKNEYEQTYEGFLASED